MLGHNSSRELDAIAAHSAVATWLGKEGEKSNLVQSGPLDLDTLRSWLTLWMLARTVAREKRQRILDFLNGHAREELLAPHASCETIELLSQLVKDRGILPGRPTSLLSKFAFSLRPDRFVPYDKRVRKALKRQDHPIKDHHYCEYFSAFRAAQREIVERCRDAALSPESLRFKGQMLQQSIFEARLADKRLMLEGGFSASLMKQDYDLNDFG